MLYPTFNYETQKWVNSKALRIEQKIDLFDMLTSPEAGEITLLSDEEIKNAINAVVAEIKSLGAGFELPIGY